MAKGTGNPTPLTGVEIGEALEASGYPFELKLFDAFAKAGMSPALGARMYSGPADAEAAASHEIDIIARASTNLVTAGSFTQANAVAIIDAKKLHDPTRLVGLLGEQPTEHERCVMRSYFFGCPSFRVLSGDHDGYSQEFLGPGGVSEGLAPLSTGPLCAHWARVERDNNGRVKAGADGDEKRSYWLAMRTLVSICVWNEREHSEKSRAMAVDVMPLPDLSIYCPTLIIDTPTLFVYDPLNGKLSETDWFMLNVSIEITGVIHSRIVDIVSAGGVPSMIKRYKDAAEVLASTVSEQGAKLKGVAQALRLRQREAPRFASMTVPARPRTL